ncbi:hypothetical protein [Akkermansia sp.]|uniref:hypothetical protein n=1 Tax=Akkermansia sp. TaxID=1872421 RepID=UPI0015E15406
MEKEPDAMPPFFPDGLHSALKAENAGNALEPGKFRSCRVRGQPQESPCFSAFAKDRLTNKIKKSERFFLS